MTATPMRGLESMKTRLKVNAYVERQKIIEGLIDSGFIVSVEETHDNPIFPDQITDYFIVIHEKGN